MIHVYVVFVISALLSSGLDHSGFGMTEALHPESISKESQYVDLPLWDGSGDMVHIQKRKVAVMKQVGFDSNVDWEDLASMCIQESTSCDEKAVGDNGMSFGAFQIHSYWHDVPDELKESFEDQTKWTADFLNSNGYQENREWAIQAHNTRNDSTMRYANAVVSRSERIKKEKE